MLLSFVVTLGPSQSAIAIMDGPTEAPPGGVILVDSDPGEGEQWGRVGGRTLEFYELQIGNFDELLWGPVDSSAVYIAFDGSVDGLGETLTYTGSLPAFPETYVWDGSTEVALVATPCNPAGVTPVTTRFLLSVTDGYGNPVTLVPHPTTGLPVVDVTTLVSHPTTGLFFTAKLEMQAMNPVSCYTQDCPEDNKVPVGEYGPALDVYDCLETVLFEEGALTGFNWGFFYDLTDIGLSLTEHDSHIANLIDSLKADTDDMSSQVSFIFDEWNLTIPGFRLDHANIINGISALEWQLNIINSNTQGLSNLSSQMTEVYQKQNDIYDSVRELPDLELLLLLFGIEYDELGMTPNPEYPTFESVKEISDLYQMLDTESLTAVLTELGLDVDEANASIEALETKIDGLDTKVDELGMKMDYLIELIEGLPLNNGGGPK